MRRILIVDDNTEVRTAVRMMLELRGFEVVEAENGEQGIQVFRQLGADLILCDVFMPGRDGLELIRELRRDFPEVRLIAMSGGGFGGSMDLLPAARLLGAAGVLHKPFTQATAVAAIDRVLQRASA